jgi:NADPH:quinone reductase-like Zn-dependent oxidoreductase
MPQAVRFNDYGDVDVLQVVDVDRPVPGAREVLVRVRAAGINPGEAKIRSGALAERWPATFPSGQGSDFAGVIEQAGDGVTGVAAGEAVIGWVDTRSSQAGYIVAEAGCVVPKPEAVPWEAAGALPVAGFTARAAVRAVGAGRGDTLVVSGAAGGVGAIAVQLARREGATVVGLAGEANHDWLRGHGVIPVPYQNDAATEPGLADRIRAVAPKVDAFFDTYGGGYVELALDQLGVAPGRVDTIVRFDAAAKYGVKTEGNAAGASAAALGELAGLIAAGDLEIPVAATYPLAQVREAYTRLATGHIRGKIVLLP